MVTWKIRGASFLIAACALSPAAFAASRDAQSVTVTDTLRIPGADLQPGTYSFSIEDRLADRAIVRVTNTSGPNTSGNDQHSLLLAVPNEKLSIPAGNRLIFFHPKGRGEQALKAWACASCSAPLEFVYPKLEAVKITDETTEPVLAVDPAYDKLPPNLSADDMKVVTLWLLSPERITAENVGEGVKAVKYTPDAAPAPPITEIASASAPAVATAARETASNAEASPEPRQRRSQLPKTASNTYLLGLCGLVSLATALALRARRMRQVSS